jgi:hypothetical protein
MKKIKIKKVVVAPAGSTSEIKTNPNQLTQNLNAMKNTQLSTQNNPSFFFLVAPSKENYTRFMTSVYLKSNGSQFLSTQNYITYIKKSLQHLGIDEETFFKTKNLQQLKLWAIKLLDTLNHNRSNKDVQDIFCAYNSYLSFARLCNGYNSPKHFFKK